MVDGITQLCNDMQVICCWANKTSLLITLDHNKPVMSLFSVLLFNGR